MSRLEAILKSVRERAPYAGPDLSRLPRRSLSRAIALGDEPRIVAEFKRRSPSRGELASAADPFAVAKEYARGGASAISVLTEGSHFGGSPTDLQVAREASGLPVLRKDFLLSTHDLKESRRMGADAVLLIVRAVGNDLPILLAECSSLGLEALVEVHDEEEAEAALEAGARMVGINNRDLSTFQVDLETTRRILPRLKGHVQIVAESGFFSREDCLPYARDGVDAFLIGEALMTGRHSGLLKEALSP